MKTKLLLIALILFSFHEFASCQEWRYADLRVQIVSPSQSTSYSSPAVIHFKFQIVNQGPDTIFTTDTLTYAPSHSYSGFIALRKKPIPSIIAPMDSAVFEDTIHINSRSFKNSFELSFSQVPMVYGQDFGKHRLVNEFSEDRDDNYSSVTLFHSGNLTTNEVIVKNSLSIYPNPVNNDYFEVESDQKIQSITIYNSYSQIVPFTQQNSNKKSTRIDVPNLTSGVYMVEFKTSTKSIIKQVIIK